MRMLLLFLAIACGTTFAQSPENSPLTPDEGRLVLGQLLELRSCREESDTLEQYIARDREQDEREKANFERALDIERQAARLAEQERDLAREKASFFEQAYKSLTKKPGVGCRILRAITLGMHRCN